MFFSMNVNHQMQFEVNYAKEQVAQRQNRALIDSIVEISTCGYLWMFFFKKRKKKKKNHVVAWFKKSRRIPESSLGPLD